MKKDYQKPMLISEEFIPNEYVAACYNFKALFHCHYGENNTNNHGEPCATTYVDINGIHATGHEGTIEKWGIPILNINWKPNNTLEILLSTGSVITFTDVSFSNHLILSNNPTLLDKIILSKKHTL